jgi:predicted nucleic acid-binding protein
VTFWDSSALVPLIVEEPASAAVRSILETDPEILIWWGTPVECLSAISRRERECELATGMAERARGLLQNLLGHLHEILASEEVRGHAERLLLRHPLRAADALQLAAAMTWTRSKPRGHRFCTLDHRLATAARQEGFQVLGA